MQTADAAAVRGWLTRMAGELRTLISDVPKEQRALIGIQSGGARIARHLHQQIDPDMPHGFLNIAFYRDDFSRIGLHPQVTPSTLSFPIDNRTVILVDDVLYSGRTVRAALNEIFDHGRPAKVILAVLVEREGHELPIRADVRGCRVNLAAAEQIKLHPSTLALELHRSDGEGARKFSTRRSRNG